MGKDGEDVYIKGTGFEIIGVRPIPRSDRYMNLPKIFIFWVMASASVTTPLSRFTTPKHGSL